MIVDDDSVKINETSVKSWARKINKCKMKRNTPNRNKKKIQTGTTSKVVDETIEKELRRR